MAHFLAHFLETELLDTDASVLMTLIQRSLKSSEGLGEG
jgi:hypothetical protein